MIAQLLDRLAEYNSQRDALVLKRQEEIDKVLTPEIHKALDEINAEFDDKAGAVIQNIADLEARIKEETLKEGKTVKGQYFMAVYNKGRVTWDGKKLDGMMALIPGIADARKEGEPTISLRKVG